MTYITPITDRSINDILAGTSKGYFNVADWERIAGNTNYAKSQVERVHGKTITLMPVIAPTIETIPTAEQMNALVGNIMLIQFAAPYAHIDNYRLFANYQDGAQNAAPDFTAVNRWEKALDDIVKTYEPIGQAGRNPIIGKAISGLKLILQNMFRKSR